MASRLSKGHGLILAVFGTVLVIVGLVALAPYLFATTYEAAKTIVHEVAQVPKLDKRDYNTRMLALAHIPVASTTLYRSQVYVTTAASLPTATSTAQAGTTRPLYLEATTTANTSVRILKKLWPAPAAYPEYGAILPFKRIVAYYGNFYSKYMGVLGEYPEDVMLQKLASTTADWTAADPNTPAIAAIDYIAVVAQAGAGKDGMYRARMPDDQIDKALELAKKVNGIVVLDVQTGRSTVPVELPQLEKYLKMPQVHLALDPEFAMKPTEKPGAIIGSMDAKDINWAIQYLSQLTRENNLPPKVLLIHRFTQDMVTHAEQITPTPDVQVVMDMDGFGPKFRKLGTYNYIVAPEPVQFTGFKLFYKNDVPPRGDHLMTPAEVISLTPAPVFIQYQ